MLLVVICDIDIVLIEMTRIDSENDLSSELSLLNVYMWSKWKQIHTEKIKFNLCDSSGKQSIQIVKKKILCTSTPFSEGKKKPIQNHNYI